MSQSCARYKSDLVNQGDGDKLIRLTGDVDSACGATEQPSLSF